MAKKWTKAQQRAHRKQWVKALRSGKYAQTRATLRDEDGFCCLGVACDISKQGKWEYSAFGSTYHAVTGSSDIYLPEAVRDWLGLATAFGDYGDETNLAGRNDKYGHGHLTFNGIASLIEREPKGLIEE